MNDRRPPHTLINLHRFLMTGVILADTENRFIILLNINATNLRSESVLNRVPYHRDFEALKLHGGQKSDCVIIDVVTSQQKLDVFACVTLVCLAFRCPIQHPPPRQLRNSATACLSS